MIYFGHSRQSYGTEEEKKALEVIRKKYPGHKILNPNKKKHQINCLDFYCGNPGTEMEYFINLTKICKFGIFMVYDETKWSPGSYTEAINMIQRGKKVYLLSTKDWKLRRITKINDYYTFSEEEKRLKEMGLDDLAGENG